MKHFLRLICICIFCILLTDSAEASALTTENQIMQQQMKAMGVGDIDRSLQSIKDSNEQVNSFSFVDTLLSAVKGELDLSPEHIAKSAINHLLKEVFENIGLMRNLIIISVICAIIKNLGQSFGNSAVGEVAFYACYIVLIIVLFNAFHSMVVLSRSIIDTMTNAMLVLLPVLTTIMAVSGNITGAAVYHPIVIFAIDVISVFTSKVIVPVIYITAVIQIVNYLTEKENLKQLTELIKKGITFVLKTVAVGFMTILSLQSVSAPIVNKAAGKSAKAVVNVVPIVGEVLTGAVDTVLHWAGAVKSGAGIAAIVFMILLVSFPLIKISAVIIMYKVTAALVEPICDARIVKCIDSVGAFTSLLLGACVMIGIMFIFSFVIVLTSQGV